MSLIKKIIEWSTDKPDWEKDIIRRLFENGSFTLQDRQEIIELIEKDQQLIDSTEIIAKPIDESFESEVPEKKKKVIFKKLYRVKNTNKLKEGEEITFIDKGLTIIYGENASGKSGYARILKRACRARYQGPAILPNVYEEILSENLAEAAFEINVGGTWMSELWMDDEKYSGNLSSIAVFDKHCARMYVNEDNQVDYLPYGADILIQLNDAFADLKSHFDEMECKELPSFTNELVEALGTIGFRDVLISNSKLDNNLYEKIVESSTLSEEEKKRLRKLEEVINFRKNNSPEKLKAKAVREKTRLESLKRKLETINSAFSDESFAVFEKLSEVFYSFKDAVEIASKENFSDELIKGVGTDTWKIMFEAARKYSEEEAYEEKSFPVIEDGSCCVLCHQELDKLAKSRLQRFDKYIKNETLQKYETAKESLKNKYLLISGLNLVLFDEGSELKVDLKTNSPLLFTQIDGFIKSAKSLRGKLKICIQKNHFKDISSIESELLFENLKNRTEELEEQIKSYESTTPSKKQLEEEKEYNELNSKETVVKHIETINTYKNLLEKNKKIQACIKLLNTGPITKFQKTLLAETVTKKLFETLKKELVKLGGGAIPLEFKESGTKGNINYRIALKDPNTRINNLSEVLSEGEEHLVAIASFFAELEMCEHVSSIVFDDPVSSLDQKWREKVAERIIEEAKKRQVIIFTHDAVFMLALQEEAQNQELENVQIQALESRGEFAGIVSKKPFEVCKLNEQIGVLRTMQQKADKINRDGDEGYNLYIKTCYSLLRQAWEKCILEVALNDVVSRFRRGVETKKLKKVAIYLKEDDYKKIYNGITKCSKITEAHSTPVAALGTFYSPDDFKTDISELDNFAKELRDRYSKK